MDLTTTKQNCFDKESIKHKTSISIIESVYEKKITAPEGKLKNIYELKIILNILNAQRTHVMYMYSKVRALFK